MCTAISYRTDSHYFGRNLDLYYSYNERVTVVPRNYPLRFRHMPTLDPHYAMIGMATVAEGYPLFYDATNEAGLSVAGLNFPLYGEYQPYREGCDNVAPFELILWILGQCKSVKEAREMISRMNLVKEDFSEYLPLTLLHFMISDRDESIVLEPVTEGLRVYDDPAFVLTNSPTFDYHIKNLQGYMKVTAGVPKDSFSETLELVPYSLGMGSIGLPGDMSSPSRFVRGAFVRGNSPATGTEAESVAQFFHILGSVSQPKGCTLTEDGRCEYTIYSSCCNTDTGVYYYTTYGCGGVTAVDMRRCDPYGGEIVTYPLRDKWETVWQN